MTPKKPKIYFVRPEIKGAGPGDPGQTTDGAFTFENDTVVVCHPDTGEPAQDPMGKTYTFKLEAPTNTLEDAHIHGKRLTKDFRKAFHGGRPEGFIGRRPLPYRKLGWC
jgi:hypothetical protein